MLTQLLKIILFIFWEGKQVKPYAPEGSD